MHSLFDGTNPHLIRRWWQDVLLTAPALAVDPGDGQAASGELITFSLDDQAHVGTEQRFDIDPAERIEVVRGPGSSAYDDGNVVFEVIDMITRSASQIAGFESAAGRPSASRHAREGRLTYGRRTENGSELQASLSGAHGKGALDNRIRLRNNLDLRQTRNAAGNPLTNSPPLGTTVPGSAIGNPTLRKPQTVHGWQLLERHAGPAMRGPALPGRDRFSRNGRTVQVNAVFRFWAGDR